VPYDAGDLSFLFFSPTRIVYGVGSSGDVALELRGLGCTKALLVTDRYLSDNTPLPAKIEKSLGGLCAGVFADVPPDSGLHVVDQGYAFARECGADGVVSLGGGSVMDTGKGIALLLREGGKLEDYQGFQLLTRKVAPHVCLPTTAGTGSEVTYIAVIKDHAKRQKLLFGDHHLIPDVAILDPNLTVGLPPGLTAATGMDALSHAVEAITSAQREPVADALALHAIRLIREWLPLAVDDGTNLSARGHMLVAATLAGAAFGNAQVGLVHAIAHTVGARHGVHHGVANAVAMPYVMRFNNSEVAGEQALIAEALGVDVRGMPDADAGLAAADAVAKMNVRLGLPLTLKDLGVPEDDLEQCAQVALSDGAIIYNGRPVFDPGEIVAVLRKAWSGDQSP
jgi:aldehyde dehydrogenase (NAD+)